MVLEERSLYSQIWLKDRKQRPGLKVLFSGWRRVNSEDLQSLMLGLVLFNFISDLNKKVNSKIFRSVYDHKLSLESQMLYLWHENSRRALQDRVCGQKSHRWASTQIGIKWCTCNKNDLNHIYTTADSELRVTTQGRGLGIIVDISLKLSESGGLWSRFTSKAWIRWMWSCYSPNPQSLEQGLLNDTTKNFLTDKVIIFFFILFFTAMIFWKLFPCRLWRQKLSACLEGALANSHRDVHKWTLIELGRAGPWHNCGCWDGAEVGQVYMLSFCNCQTE